MPPIEDDDSRRDAQREAKERRRVVVEELGKIKPPEPKPAPRYGFTVVRDANGKPIRLVWGSDGREGG